MMRILICCLLLCLPLAAQRGPEADHSVVSQVRIDLRDLGYPPLDVIPSDECAIRAMAVGPDGSVWGATSGKRSHLFVLDPVHGYVQPLGFLKGISSVHRSLAVGADGEVYLGTDRGSLLRYTPKNDYRRPIRVNEPAQVEELGSPVEGEAIYTLAIDRLRKVIYGVTSPGAEFFSYSLQDKKFSLHGKLAERRIPGERFEQDKNIGRALVLDGEGSVYTSGEGGSLFRFDGKLVKLNLTVPTVKGREVYDRVDAWAEDGAGTFYGGTSDGYLFRFNPKTLQIDNLGKPLNQYRIRGLVYAPNGKLYGAGGDDDEMARMFSYDPTRGVYEMLGFIDVNRRPYYMWHAYVVDAMAIGKDGTVYIGQAERRSKLYLYHPETK